MYVNWHNLSAFWLFSILWCFLFSVLPNFYSSFTNGERIKYDEIAAAGIARYSAGSLNLFWRARTFFSPSLCVCVVSRKFCWTPKQKWKCATKTQGNGSSSRDLCYLIRNWVMFLCDARARVCVHQKCFAVCAYLCYMFLLLSNTWWRWWKTQVFRATSAHN